MILNSKGKMDALCVCVHACVCVLMCLQVHEYV